MNNVVVDNGVVSTDLFTSQFVQTHAERTTRVFVSYLFVPSLQDHENCIAFGGNMYFWIHITFLHIGYVTHCSSSVIRY